MPVLVLTAIGAPTVVSTQAAPAAPVAAGVCANASEPITSDTLDAVIADAWGLVKASRLPQGVACFERVLAAIETAGTPAQEAEALLGMGQAERALGRYSDALRRHERAVTLFREQGNASGEGRALRHVSLDFFYLGQNDRAVPLMMEAKAILERLGDRANVVLIYNNLMYLVDAGPEKDVLRAEALRVAREANDLKSECGVLHEWGDEYFAKGEYANARTKLTEALSCHERAGDPAETGMVLVSLGRVHRAHGRVDIALAFYKRALELQDHSGDETAAIQSLNAVGTAYDRLGRDEEALAYYEKASARATAIGSTQMVAFLKGQLGGHYLKVGEVQRSIPLLEESLRLDPRHRVYRLAQLAEAYALVGRQNDALDFGNQAVELARTGNQDELIVSLHRRSEVHRMAGRLTDAQRDLTEALTVVETLRANTIATDFMKRGFGSVHQAVYSSSIELLEQRGRTMDALETAEQARARAFLDLLASRSPSPSSSIAKNPAATNATKPAADATGAIAARTARPETVQAKLESAQPPTSVRRGSDAGGAAAQAGRSNPDTRGGTSAGATETTVGEAMAAETATALPSEQIASVPSIDEVRATARRLKSTLLVYWVGYRATHIWVVSPSGQIRSARSDVTAARLRALVAAANASIESATAGLGALGGQTKPWRELHKVLIAPVKAFLPSAPNSLLTIVPHGPLFQVSFAALQDEGGKYLLERYRLHYTPAIGVLAFTAARKYDVSPAAATALLVGDPEPLPREPDEDPMPALPWARREVDEIGRLIAPERADVFKGEAARESTIRSRIEQADLLHFATHGVVRQEEAFASFLALSDSGPASAPVPGVDKSGPSASLDVLPVDSTDDGRLTADEVYGLHLHARLVVLSACRTALGPLTGDGVIGFTRAFLYAGAASVVATSWDVPDEAGYEVMRRFYRARNETSRTADALRTAQLAVLASLRKGTLEVTTPGGRFTPREHPLYWAGFLVVGEP
jgi:CHAT domain-containing protein/tetratricopeptide (TPR) repeat protein